MQRVTATDGDLGEGTVGLPGICQCDLVRYRFIAAFVVLAFAAAGCSSSSGPDTAVVRLKDQLADRDGIETGARRMVELMALTLQGSLLVRHAPPAVADAFCASRFGGDWGHAFGTLPASTAFGTILDRALPGSGVSFPRPV